MDNLQNQNDATEQASTANNCSPRHSVYGFYCGECKKFVYDGYDARDKTGLPNNCAVCVECGDNYFDK